MPMEVRGIQRLHWTISHGRADNPLQVAGETVTKVNITYLYFLPSRALSLEDMDHRTLPGLLGIPVGRVLVGMQLDLDHLPLIQWLGQHGMHCCQLMPIPCKALRTSHQPDVLVLHLGESDLVGCLAV